VNAGSLCLSRYAKYVVPGPRTPAARKKTGEPPQ
jgi:hypothetical protein